MCVCVSVYMYLVVCVSTYLCNNVGAAGDVLQQGMRKKMLSTDCSLYMHLSCLKMRMDKVEQKHSRKCMEQALQACSKF